MTLRRLVLLSCILGILSPLGAQQSSTPSTAPLKDPQAIAALQQTVAAIGTSFPLDSVASGSIQTTAGSQESQGTIQILTKGFAETSVQISLPDGTRTTIYANGQANDVIGSTVTVQPLELVVTSQAPEFPFAFLAALLNDPDTSFQYVGLETSNGLSLQHIKTWDSYASQPALQSLSSFSTRDIWIDAVTGLPQRISYARKPAQGAVPSVAVDVFYSNYQRFSGGLYPLTIQESVNGTPWATISIQTVSFNTGLTDSSFPVQ
jgi:hypothetical protein